MNQIDPQKTVEYRNTNKLEMFVKLQAARKLIFDFEANAQRAERKSTND